MDKLGVSIMLVEDHPLFRTMYGNFLKSLSDKVYTAENGKEGIEVYRKNKPEIVVTDIKMPVMDGLEMIKEIRKFNDQVKFILVSGHQETDYFIRSIELGVQGYLLKPINKEHFRKLISDQAQNILLDRKIKETEKRFRDLAELLPEIVFEADLDGKLTFVNKRALEILGYDDPVSRKNLYLDQIITESNDTEARPVNMNDLIANKYLDQGIEVLVRLKNGMTFPALIYASSIYRDKQPVGIRGVAVNISEKKEMIRELQSLNVDLENKVNERTKLLKQRIRFIELINRTSSEFIRMDNQQINEGINKALKDVGQFTRVERGYVYLVDEEKDRLVLTHEWKNKNLKSLNENLGEMPVGEMTGELDKLRSGSLVSIDKQNKQTDDGNPLQMNGFKMDGISSMIHLPLFFGNKFIGFYGFDSRKKSNLWTEEKINAYEITGQIIANAIQRKVYDEELIKAKEKAEESDKSKSVFLASISHEIQTPIKAILSFSNLLQSADLDKERRQEFINIINSNGQALLSLTNDILEFTRIQSNIIKLFNIDFELNLFLKEMFTVFDSLKEKKGKQEVELRLKIPEQSISCMVNFDPSRLKQIFTNLIGNAFKFTSEGFVEYGYELMDNGGIRLFVKDTGIGISPKYQRLIFDRFIQEPQSAEAKKEGTGLGLAITHSLVKMYNGDIWVESELGRGSKFIIEFPSIIVSEDKEEEPQHNWPDKTILVVEKHIRNYISLENMLKNRLKLLYVSDFNQALELCKARNDIDLLIIDSGMVMEEGETVILALKGLNKDLIFIGIRDSRESRLLTLFDDIISKPFKENQVLNILERYFS